MGQPLREEKIYLRTANNGAQKTKSEGTTLIPELRGLVEGSAVDESACTAEETTSPWLCCTLEEAAAAEDAALEEAATGSEDEEAVVAVELRTTTTTRRLTQTAHTCHFISECVSFQYLATDEGTKFPLKHLAATARLTANLNEVARRRICSPQIL